MTAQQPLTGPEAGELLAVAVEAGGGRLVSWRANHVDGPTVGYRVRVSRDGAEVEDLLGATTAQPLPGGVTVLGDGASQVGVWRAAHDPALPGMRVVLGAGHGHVRLRSYRPLKRAVFEVVGPRGRFFVKVVPPSKVRDLRLRHQLITEAGIPAPRCVGWSEDGLLALEALSGRNLRSSLTASPTELIGLLDRLPAGLLVLPKRSSWLARTSYYAEVVAGAIPELSSWATELASSVVAAGHEGPIVPVHGDFYEAQLMVGASGNVTGVLDVDTAGPGDRLDDLGCLLGHLGVLAQVLPHRAAAIGRFEAECLAVFDRVVDPRQLRLRAASVVLSLATGPHRVQEAGWQQATRDRLQLASRWLESADRANRKERNHHVSNA
ncbi:phosphotransferase family enzyme [Kribbella sp. VKM Ac-2527]|uniref:Phosphotransferase family enzyme n=1 Tax=Kribbella caucasensis TaxID=2512215 RepID=A0A4R6K486_9ACTN|nr:aminoglycoside phosphotransferase family protein [Kribbella sp. VKM Ac-2527]TDO44110.1 phosphotransferase family enzyme [Kribbella sp. VKM Ac-2527]